MNPQYMPQQQFGVPSQNFTPGKLGSGILPPGPTESFNEPNAGSHPLGPFGYKGPMGQPSVQNNLGSASPNLHQQGLPPMLPPGQMPGQPGLPLNPSHFPLSQGQMRPQNHQLPPQRLNGPTQGPPAQFQGSVRLPNLPQGQLGPSQRQMFSPAVTQGGSSQGQMLPLQNQMGQHPGKMGMGPTPGQLPPTQGQMGPPQTQLGPQGLQMGPPHGHTGPQQVEPPQNLVGPPQNLVGPPQNLVGPPQMPPPQGQVNMAPEVAQQQTQMGPSNDLMGPPQGHMPPQGQGPMPPQGQMVQQLQMPPQGQMAPQGQMPPQPRLPVNSAPNQPGQMLGNANPLGPPQQVHIAPVGSQPGNPNMVNNFGPPKPGIPQNMPPSQYPQKPGGPTQYPGMPPPIGQPGQNSPGQQFGQGPNFMPQNSMGPNQVANQMSGMQIGGQRQYPGAPMKPTVNGDNSPHMPPPLGQTQGQFINGSQNRGPPQQMGYPPMSAQSQMPGGPYPPQSSYQAPQQARRLDPDQMPSPIQVTQDDQRTRSGIFCTNQKGLVPPLVSTTFTTQDQGNVSPRFIRSTMYNVPTTSDMMKQTSVPFGLVISPLARPAEQEYPPPIVDFGELGPVRCIRCKAYMCPFMQFIDSGRRFQCLFCKATTEVPAEYFQHLDHTGQRVDRYERPELVLGTYEFVATKDYCRNNTYPKPPAIVFIIDVSYNNMKSGLVQLICAEMKEILKNLPIDQGHEKSEMKVGFITYNSTVHFYNIKGSLAQPQMMVVGDTQEMFMPLLDGFLCDVEDSASIIDSLMEQIPAMFAETRETETVLLPAIQAGLEALKASECAGKLLIFHSTLPTAEAPGRLKNRDDRKLLGTEKEKTVLIPQTQAYNQLGMDCVGSGCSVDLFVFNNSYIDVATISQVSRLSGGEVFKYTYFQADVDGHRLVSDIITDISRPVAFDTIMRVRTSTGVRPTEFFGHYYMSNTTDMEIAAIDCDKAVAVEIKHDDKLTEEEGVYIQVALLYTSCSGQRRLRVLNLSLKTCSQMADLYRSCELDTIVNFFAKQSVYRLLENNPKAVKESLVNRCAQILACYRKNCASPSSAGQLILPECMKLLPLYVNCLLKSDAISGGSDMTLDDRSFVMQAVSIMDIPTSVVYFYPRLIPLHEIQNVTENPETPNAVRCTVEKMVDNGVYLLDNGIHMLMWIGLSASPEWIQSVFGVPTAGQVDTDRFQVPELDNNLSVAVRNIIDQVQFQRHRCMRLTMVRQRDKLETVFRHFLVEDRGQDGTSSYVDFLCHMHKEIRQLLS